MDTGCRRIIIALLFFVGLVAWMAYRRFIEPVAVSGLKAIDGHGPVLKAIPADRDFYDTAFGFPRTPFDPGRRTIVAGVVPHHLLAADLIADFYRHLASTSAGTVVIIGPNHFNAGEAPVITADADWETPFGVLPVDRELLQAIRSAWLGIALDNEALRGEHAITAHAAFIKKTWPRAQVLPLILRHDMAAQETDMLAATLNALGKERDLLLIASVDFSHYQDSDTAIANDKQSIQALAAGDLGAIDELDLDSPPSIRTLMTYAAARPADFVLLRNSNSALLAGRPEIESTTSYVTGYWLAGEGR